jgi:Raf kinase inhibitor-like YbhB/YbcL family protein
MKITSSAFQHHQQIPRKYSCDGQNINPPLVFVDVPQAARSLVLIVDDPDAPRGTWVHWLVYNIPPDVREVKEHSAPRGDDEFWQAWLCWALSAVRNASVFLQTICS